MKKTAVISGSTRGIGFAAAKKLISDGIDIVLSARHTKELQEKIEELNRLNGGKAYGYACDFSQTHSIVNFAQTILKKHSPVSILINNVGSYIEDTVFSEDIISNAEQLFRINVLSAVQLTHLLIQDMISQPQAHIINIGSVLSENSRPNSSSYTISKHALLGFSKSLREDLKNTGVQITDILPESVNTSSWDGIDAPKDKFIQPEEIALLISDILKMDHSAVEMVKIKNRLFI
ncbi:MAG TPA: hypothetical protein DIU39_01190 [Flavobacteriales bacterium]|nr:hypothetical protein [Flavobacteriales bacterium]|tara:strand:+ start:23075 stop:23776 length:702 start_codon:yes stop_codon:yes gene_type:complete